MKKFIVGIVLALSVMAGGLIIDASGPELSVVPQAQASLRPNMVEPGGGPTGACNSGTPDDRMWAYDPHGNYGYFACRYIGITDHLVYEGRCYGCSVSAYWEGAYAYTTYYLGAYRWVRLG